MGYYKNIITETLETIENHCDGEYGTWCSDKAADICATLEKLSNDIDLLFEIERIGREQMTDDDFEKELLERREETLEIFDMLVDINDRFHNY